MHVKILYSIRFGSQLGFYSPILNPLESLFLAALTLLQKLFRFLPEGRGDLPVFVLQTLPGQAKALFYQPGALDEVLGARQVVLP